MQVAMSALDRLICAVSGWPADDELKTSVGEVVSAIEEREAYWEKRDRISRAEIGALNKGIALLRTAARRYIDVLNDYRRKALDDHPGSEFWVRRFCQAAEALAVIAGSRLCRAADERTDGSDNRETA